MPLFCHFLWSVELTSTIFVFVREDEETNSIIVSAPLVIYKLFSIILGNITDIILVSLLLHTNR